MKLDMSILDGGKLSNSTRTEAGTLQDLSTEGLAQQFPLPAVKDVRTCTLHAGTPQLPAAPSNVSTPAQLAPAQPSCAACMQHPQPGPHPCMTRSLRSPPKHCLLTLALHTLTCRCCAGMRPAPAPAVLQVDQFEREVVEMVKPCHGTTTLGFIFQHGVIIAVDSRATMGSYVCE